MSSFLLAPILAWVAAQGIKYLVFSVRNKRFNDLSFWYQSGNMPSAHTAIVTALVTVVGAREGVESPLFAVVFIFSIIIAYDAMHVRRAAGEQGLAIVQLLEKAKLVLTPHHALGHKPIEVAVGAVIGILTAVAVLSFT